MISLEKYRIIDLSREVYPGLLKVSGEYQHGNETRRFEARQFIYAPDKTYMHWVETETHIGTHVEVPAHLLPNGKSCSQMPIDTFIGKAIVLKFDFLKPRDGRGAAITPSHLLRVESKDIVLMWSPYVGEGSPYISPEAAACLAERPIKMLGVQNVRVEAPDGLMSTHNNLLRRDIPIIEGLINLEKIRKEKVFFIGLPLRIAYLDSSWIRAIALEPIENNT
ncbi:MAG: cyclase family protein [Nitrososphaerota archaeon]|nr:cyclase family protein [Candidatus Bathyarchaeota archaeon]MDW8048898.1 cyclase family protein [Nitrososphaerota archaeon]